MKQFSILWSGQIVSAVGSGLTGFSLGVWVYQSTGSVTPFALTFLFNTLPGILFSPVAGVMVDRWDRRSLMLASDTAAALCSLTIFGLLWADRLALWHIYLVMGLGSLCRALRWPALTAATTLLVPRRHYGRVGGMTQLGEALAMTLSPMVAGLLIDRLGLESVILLDLATFVFALLTLAVVRIPMPATPEGRTPRGDMRAEIAESWVYLKEHRGLMALLLLFAGTNFAIAMVQVLFRPLVLSFTTPEVLGQVLAASGIGYILGGAAMSVWGGPRRRMAGIHAMQTLQGLILFLAAVQASAALIAVAGFLFFFGASVVNSSSQAIWQSKVEPGIQGRVFSLRRLVVTATLPLAYVVGGPLADHVFEPLLAPDGALAASVGSWIGVGKGRGIALLILLLGAWMLVLVALAHRYRPLRRVEIDLPDAIGVQAVEA